MKAAGHTVHAHRLQRTCAEQQRCQLVIEHCRRAVGLVIWRYGSASARQPRSRLASPAAAATPPHAAAASLTVRRRNRPGHGREGQTRGGIAGSGGPRREGVG